LCGTDHLCLTFKLKAADVDASGFVNAADALMTARRFAGVINTFPAGDWTFENKSVSIPSSGTITENFKAICMGDVNGSNTPPLKEGSQVLLIEEETLLLSPINRFEIPLRVTHPLQAGAISLVLSYNPSQLDVLGVAAPSEGSLIYKAEQGILKIAWFSLNPMILSPGDICITVSVLCNYNSDEGFFIIDPGSVVGDEQANPIPQVILLQPRVRFHNDVVQVYPNPCFNELNISVSVLSKGEYEVSLHDITGKVVLQSSIRSSEANSPYQINMDGISPGLYTCRIEGPNISSHHFKVVKK